MAGFSWISLSPAFAGCNCFTPLGRRVFPGFRLFGRFQPKSTEVAVASQPKSTDPGLKAKFPRQPANCEAASFVPPSIIIGRRHHLPRRILPKFPPNWLPILFL